MLSITSFIGSHVVSEDLPAFARLSERTLAEYTALPRRYVREPLGKLKLSDLSGCWRYPDRLHGNATLRA